MAHQHLTKDYLVDAINRGLTKTAMAKELGCSITTVFLRIKKFGVKTPKRIVEGVTRFGMLQVLQRAEKVGHSVLYECQCDCGNITKVLRCNLLGHKHTRSCGCLTKRENHKHPRFKGHGEISANHWWRIHQNANIRNIQVNVTIEQIWDLFLKQKRTCALSGLCIEFSSRYKTTASLDRINSSLDYSIQNVQWVHKDINRMKQHFLQEHFIELCERVAAAEDKRYPEPPKPKRKRKRKAA